MTREEAINEINKVFTSAYANYIVTALTEGATVSDIQHRWGRAYEAGVKDGLEQKPCEDAASRKSVITIIQNHWWNCRDIDKLVNELPPVTPQESRWIPVSERLPEESDNYLVTNDDGDVEMAYFAHPKDYAISKGEWREIWYEDDVIAWMPLPQPYKAESEENKLC